MVNCIIRDMTSAVAQTRFNVNLPESKTCRELVEEVAKNLGYEPNSFVLSYEKPEDDEFVEVNMEAHLDQPISSVCANVGNNKRNTFTVMDKDGVAPVKVESKDSGLGDAASVGATASPGVTESKDIYSSTDYSVGTWSNTYSSGNSYASALMKSDTGYVGLVNQAMTCYLNSLLQTLYMTPEFRNAVYRWAFDGVHQTHIGVVKSIPYQLQRLFLLLQTSTRRAIETTDITKSFGWDSSEAWQQHDVQELMRVMFDALEKKWKNTNQSDLINKLYQGQMKDYVECLECGNESARTDSYLDIPLTIRAFGSNQTYNSVDESLKAFVQYEQLEGDNQYFCEKCNKKCDAHKGLKFTSFPYLLTLQLKRFDFDYTTMHRIKLNEKMTFPEILNLNHIVDGLNPEEQKPKDGDGGGEEGGGSNVDGPDVSPSAASCPPPEQANSYDNDEGIDEGIEDGSSASGGRSSVGVSSSEAAANDRNAKNSAVKGPYEYELYSIMIHSGSAAGGHYYAYIKSFRDGRWYSFNDQHVSTITYDDIRKVYGGSTGTRGYYSSTYASSTNAYMLVYRQIDKDRNEDFIRQDDFPKHLKEELYKLQNREEEEKKQRELEKSTCKIKLFVFHPVQRKQLESKLEVHKDATLKSATEIAWKQFELNKLVPVDCVRLVKFDEFNDYIEKSYEGDEDKPMEEVLEGVKTSYMFDLLVEVKRPDQVFQVYKTGGITIKVHVCDIEKETIDPPVSVRAYQTQTLEEFKKLLSHELQLPGPPQMRMALERYCSELKLLTLPHKSLKSEGFFKTNRVFVECSGIEDDDVVVFSESRLGVLLDRYEHTIRIHITLPPSDAKVKIPKETNHSNDTRSNDSDEGIGNESDVQSNSLQGNTSDNNGVISDSSVSGNNANSTLPQVPSNSRPSLVGDKLQQTLSGSAGDLTESNHQQQQQQQPSSVTPATSGEQSSQEDSESTVTSSLDSNSTVTSCSTVTPSEPVSSLNVEDDEHALNTDILNSKVRGIASSQSAAASSTNDQEPLLKFEYPTKEINREIPGTENWDDEAGGSGDTGASGMNEVDSDDEYRKYCTIKLNVDTQTKERSLIVCVDKRITLKAVKKELEPYVGTRTDYFKIYKVYSNNQEFECTKPNETLTGYGDDCKLIVKHGRALKKGECRVKIYQLLLNKPEHSKFLLEVIVAKGMTVAKVRRMVVDELKEECDINMPLDRCRIRKKSWKSPSTIFLDDQLFDHDIPLLSTLELFVEKLEGPERLQKQSQMSIYARRWWPSKHEINPFQEIIVCDSKVSCLKEEISKTSGIPVENVEFARAKGTFPCEVSVLEAHTELDWNTTVQVINAWPVSINDDGCIIYYRNSEEELEKLTEERKKELQQKENIRLARYNTYSSKYSIHSRKERALKIYTDDSPVKDHHSSTSHSYHTSPSSGKDWGSSTTGTQVSSVTSAISGDNDTELD